VTRTPPTSPTVRTTTVRPVGPGAATACREPISRNPCTTTSTSGGTISRTPPIAFTTVSVIRGVSKVASRRSRRTPPIADTKVMVEGTVQRPVRRRPPISVPCHAPGARPAPDAPGDPSVAAGCQAGTVTDIGASPWSRRRFLGGVAGLAGLVGVAAACGRDPGAPGTGSSGTGGGTGSGLSPAGRGEAPAADAELIGRRYPGLKPFAAAPAAPPVRPVVLNPAHPTVFARVPVTDKVVFVTIDDGVEKDPAFIRMVEDFRIPLTVCLADTLIRDDYAYFARLHATGHVSIQNHTVTHPLNMPRLSAARQLDEIAGQQERLRARYGTVPRIFRPPGGTYDATTLDAVRAAGLGGLLLWKEAMQIEDMQYQTARHRLSRGDVVLCHFRGPAQLKGRTMVEMMAALYRSIQAQGFTVADLSAYV